MALGLSTRKALSILKEQLEAVLEGHLKERKKCLTWKVGQSLAGMAEQLGPILRAPTSPAALAVRRPQASLKIRKELGCLSQVSWPLLP